MPATSVNPEKILRELRELWVELGKEQDRPGGVLRACAMTLVVVADSAHDDVPAVHEMIGVLMHDHPSRAIVYSPRESVELSARVFSECWMPYHSRQQICSEGIEITADCEQTDEVARLLVPLIVPDLPVVLWCRGARAFLDRTLDPLFPLARKIIFDTGAVRHAPSAIEFLRRLRQDGRNVADLAWTRLTVWREAVASIFDADRGDPLRFETIRLEYVGVRPGSEALYLARWLGRTCPAANVTLQPASPEAESESKPEAGPQSSVRAIVFSTAPSAKPVEEISLRRVGGSLEMSGSGYVCTSVLPHSSEETIMREELSILDGDPIFDRVLS